MVIDFHTHSFPGKLAKRAILSLSRASHTVPFTDGTAEGLSASMREAGIDLSVVLPVATSAHQVEQINHTAAVLNERWKEQGIFSAGAIHPDCENWKSALTEVKNLGLKGIKIHPVYQNADINDIRFLRILDRCAELGLFVVTHAGLDIGFPGVVRCSPEMVSDALRQVKGVRMILAHMGGWKNWKQVPEFLSETNAYLDTAFSTGRFYPLDDGYWQEEETRMLDEDGVMRIIHAFGPERILFGTDSPWSSQMESLDYIRHLPLEERELEKILGGNAEKFLFEASCR